MLKGRGWLLAIQPQNWEVDKPFSKLLDLTILYTYIKDNLGPHLEQGPIILRFSRLFLSPSRAYNGILLQFRPWLLLSCPTQFIIHEYNIWPTWPELPI